MEVPKAFISIVMVIIILMPVISNASDAPTMRSTARLLYQFSASDRYAVFPVINDQSLTSLELINTETGHVELLTAEGYSLLSPAFSQDGNSLIFARADAQHSFQSLIICRLKDWSCTTVAQIDGSIVSPVEMNSGDIIFSSSPLIRGSDGKSRFSSNNFYVYMHQSHAVFQISNLDLYSIGAISSYDGNIYFSAVGPSEKISSIPPLDPLSESRTDIFSASVGVNGDSPIEVSRIKAFANISGISTNASVSRSGDSVAFLNSPMGLVPYRYDLVVTDINGKIKFRNEAKDGSFSRPSFVADKVVVAQISLEGAIQIKTFDIKPGNAVGRVIDVPTNTPELVEHITIKQ